MNFAASFTTKSKWVRGGGPIIYTKLILLMVIFSTGLRADPTKDTKSTFSQEAQNDYIKISAGDLAAEMALKQKDVAEFARIREMAERRGLRVFLFGGTAAGYAHYVKWDLERRRGLRELHAARFDYEYTHIFRHNQDLDLVVSRVDGRPETEEEIASLRDEILSTFEYGRGDKTQWELRGLKTSFGNKGALFESPDFLNQHTDSNSTGLIELTRGKSLDPVVQDLRDMKSYPPQFLNDVVDGKLHYYFSKDHEATKRAKEGLNPPILSAIRYLTKALQYDLAMDVESRAHVLRINREWDPRTVAKDSYVAGWIEKNAKKLIQNASDLESAWNLIEELGLRKKLIALKGNPGEMNSLAWWMSKEPLRTRPHSEGFKHATYPQGKTAGELKIDFVTHATKTFEAYEAITRSPSGKPNLFISRPDTEYESASEGAGLYSLSGKVPPNFTQGYAIRFRVDPAAREGVDFRRVGDFVIWMTGTHLSIIPDEIKNNVTPLEAFEFFVDPRNFAEEGVKHRIARSVGKIQLDHGMSDTIRARMREMIQKNDWVGLNEATLLPAARSMLPGLLKELNLGLPELQNLKQHPMVHANQVALMRIAYPMTKSPKEFLQLMRLSFAPGYRLEHSLRIMQLGVLVNEAADHFLTLSPSMDDFHALKKDSTYYVHHLRGLTRKSLPLVKNMVDLNKALAFTIWPASDFYRSEIAGFVADNAAFIMSLGPNADELRALREHWMNKNGAAIARFNSNALPHVKNIAEFESLIAHPEQTQAVATSGNHFEEWFADHISEYIRFGANLDRIKALESVSIYFASTPMKLWKESLSLVKTTDDFFKLIKPSWPNMTTDAHTCRDEFILGHFDFFMSLKPTKEEEVRFRREVYFTKSSVEIENKLWDRSSRSLDDFFWMAKPAYESASFSYQSEHATLVHSHLSDFFAAKPTVADFERLLNLPIWMSNPKLSKTDPMALEYFFGTKEKKSKLIGSKTEFEAMVKFFSEPTRQSQNELAERKIGEVIGHYIELGATIADVKKLERESFWNVSGTRQLWEEAVRHVHSAADFVELFKDVWQPASGSYYQARSEILKNHLVMFRRFSPTWEEWNQLRNHAGPDTLHIAQIADEMIKVFSTARAFIDTIKSGWDLSKESHKLYAERWAWEKIDSFLSTVAPTKKELLEFLNLPLNRKSTEAIQHPSIAKYVLNHAAYWLAEEGDPVAAARELLKDTMVRTEDRMALIRIGLAHAKNTADFLRLTDFISNPPELEYRSAIEDLILKNVSAYAWDAKSRKEVWHTLMTRTNHSIEFKRQIASAILKSTANPAEVDALFLSGTNYPDLFSDLLDVVKERFSGARGYLELEKKYRITKLGKVVAIIGRSCGNFFRQIVGVK